MNRIDLLNKNYQRICGLPWDRNVAGSQRVWLAVYDKEDEGKLRLRLGLFREATEHTGHHWRHCDLTEAFAHWLTSPPYQDYAASYFEAPKRLGAAPLDDFKRSIAQSTSHWYTGEASGPLPPHPHLPPRRGEGNVWDRLLECPNVL